MDVVLDGEQMTFTGRQMWNLSGFYGWPAIVSRIIRISDSSLF